MKKHIHKIIINGNKRYKHKYNYNFSNTNDISIELSPDSLCITAELTKIYDKNEMISQGCYLFPDAIKKALTLHLILFSKNILIKKMMVQIDDECDVVIDTTQGHISPIFSMVEGNLHNPISSKWNEKEIRGFLKLTKSSEDSRLAALNAFIISKSKIFETERFIYLWTAFNGMYNYIFSKILENPRAGDRDKILYIQKLYEIGEELVRDTKGNKIEKEFADKVKALIYHKYDPTEPLSRDSLENGKYLFLSNFINDNLRNKNTDKPYNITPYGYILTQFSYYFRCNIIHGDKPYALFSFANESEIKCLKCINELLDEFIENNLHCWFDEAAINLLKEKAKEI